VTQLPVGFEQGLALFALPLHDMRDHVTSNQEKNRAHKNRALIGDLIEDPHVVAKVQHQDFQSRRKDTVKHHRLEVVLPGGQDQWNE
jgi:hypothetical protein